MHKTTSANSSPLTPLIITAQHLCTDANASQPDVEHGNVHNDVHVATLNRSPRRASRGQQATTSANTASGSAAPAEAHQSLQSVSADAVAGKLLHAGAVRSENQRLVSDDQVIHALLSFVQAANAPLPEQIASNSNAPTTLEIRAHPQLKEALKAFKETFMVGQANLLSATDPSGARVYDEIDGDIHIALLQKAIEKGASAFGQGAMITHAGEDLTAAQFLALHAPSIHSNNDFLEVNVKQRVDCDRDLLVRLGAQSLLHAATKKETKPIELLGSLAASSGLGSLWELKAAQTLKDTVFGAHYSPSKHALQLAGIDSVPPLLIETLDTMCVLSIVQRMKGKKEPLSALLRKATTAGAISSVLSFPNNLLQYTGFKSRPADLAANVLTTEAAIFGAASGLPPEVKESEEHMRAGLLHSMRTGVLAAPPDAASARQTVEQMTKHALEIGPGESTAVKSMGVAAIVGLIPLIASDKATGLVSEQVLRIFRSTVFNPIEAIALNALALSSRVNIPKVFDSHDTKHARLVQTILIRASQQMDAEERTISPEELHERLGQQRNFLHRLGTAIVDGMNAMLESVPTVVRKLGYGEPSLNERIPYEDLHVPLPPAPASPASPASPARHASPAPPAPPAPPV
ncbi:XopB/HopD1 family type III secretion system effector [Xanthomonas translucens]|uniref:XopB/HopD1 family type III secretion system effector n=1 Tax=Xanthomonas campestris pv. translucens TaxID=343 RepID=UPI00071E72FE|nr:XopB/HopD1 family type III secretion system effector [Xanthomonas translucens]KWV10266.1 type III effector [Xanthomonas translucens]MCS3359878.1 type III effector [Xanthomonas translucens pv. translucens]MCS3373680.1 type III effector [Xanthomonas translucens pv. translucens]MCT8274362.1 type III effector [Xanthomonas translucens pv. translucens]MCT8278272.1 type III effector [Xanthomonas translucens pv. translucens]